MNRRGAASIAANPVLIGAATTLVVIVAVFLAYNANNGLPFVPTYDLRTVVPNAANLVPGNEVRIGGSRVGVVDQITPRRERDGSVSAVLTLKLETAVQPLPNDSTVLVRPRSALGLKYVELTRGESRQGFAAGATVPLARATPRPVEIDEVLATFDEPTRAGSRVNLTEFGGALSGRGVSINNALGVFPLLLQNLQPAMENLSDPRTDLPGFFRGLGQAAAEAAPVAEEQASLFRGLDTTFGALADVRDELQDTISTGPEALDAGIRGFPVQRPFLRNSGRLFAELRPGIRSLRNAAPDLAEAFAIGQPVLRRSVQLNRRLEPTFRSLQAFAEDPLSSLGLRGLRNTAAIANPIVADLRPVQTVCNYVSLWFRNVASLLSEGDDNGTWQRFIIVSAPTGENNEGGPSSRPASNAPPGDFNQPPPPQSPIPGRRVPFQVPSPAGGEPDGNFLHTNPYPNTPDGPGGRTDECESGNEPWLGRRTVIGNVPGDQGRTTERTEIQRDSEGSLSNAVPPEQVGGGDG